MPINIRMCAIMSIPLYKIKKRVVYENTLNSRFLIILSVGLLLSATICMLIATPFYAFTDLFYNAFAIHANNNRRAVSTKDIKSYIVLSRVSVTSY